MSKKKRIITTKAKDKSGIDNVSKIKPTVSRNSNTARAAAPAVEMVFKKENYYYMIGGVVLMALGMLLMSGGFNEDPNVFDESVIYSHRRITLAPMVILAGLGLEIYAIFR